MSKLNRKIQKSFEKNLSLNLYKSHFKSIIIWKITFYLPSNGCKNQPANDILYFIFFLLLRKILSPIKIYHFRITLSFAIFFPFISQLLFLCIVYIYRYVCVYIAHQPTMIIIFLILYFFSFVSATFRLNCHIIVYQK
jgi:hypothetical protein